MLIILIDGMRSKVLFLGKNWFPVITDRIPNILYFRFLQGKTFNPGILDLVSVMMFYSWFFNHFICFFFIFKARSGPWTVRDGSRIVSGSNDAAGVIVVSVGRY